MPAADALAPALSPEAREVAKGSGGWTNTVHTFGGKAYEIDDIEETRQIVERMAEEDERQAASGEGNEK